MIQMDEWKAYKNEWKLPSCVKYKLKWAKKWLFSTHFLQTSNTSWQDAVNVECMYTLRPIKL